MIHCYGEHVFHRKDTTQTEIRRVEGGWMGGGKGGELVERRNQQHRREHAGREKGRANENHRTFETEMIKSPQAALTLLGHILNHSEEMSGMSSSCAGSDA